MTGEIGNIQKILLVEDDLRDVELTLAALTEHHLANQVTVVRDGEQALDYLYRRGEFQTRPDGHPVVILLDLKMPKINGLEVLKILKADAQLKIIPVVVLSSSRETPDLAECYQHGVNAYVVKPVDFSEFMKAVQQLGVFWAAINEPPPRIGQEAEPPPGAEKLPPIRKEVKSKSPLRILHLEDDPNDAALVRSTLEAEGIHCEIACVLSREAFLAGLAEGGVDLILSDFSVPAFDGFSALEIARVHCPDVPFILVSGTLGEELAIDSLQRGATDYVLKQRLSRLVPAVHRAMQEVKERVERKQAEARRREYSRKLQVLSRRLVEVQETERRNIARELHDEIGQALTVMQINLQAMLQLPGAEALTPRLNENLKVVERVLEQVHDISLNLRPSILDDLGLEPALRWYTERQAALVELKVEFHADPLEQRLDSIIETECFRVAQEALTNVVRHAQAKVVSVELRRENNQLHLRVRDDGIGFDVAAVREKAVLGASLGLLGMEERAALAGGGLEFTSSPSRGSEVHAWFPLKWQTVSS